VILSAAETPAAFMSNSTNIDNPVIRSEVFFIIPPGYQCRNREKHPAIAAESK
jgi:hypothetical protein